MCQAPKTTMMPFPMNLSSVPRYTKTDREAG